MALLRRLRSRLGLLAVNKWPLKALLRLMRPLAVILNRLAAARLVFILLPIGTCLSHSINGGQTVPLERFASCSAR